MQRRTWCRAALAGLAGAGALLSPMEVPAESWPARPVRFVVPMPPGSGLDTIAARPLAQKLAERWGQPVVIDNVAGAGGTIGAAQVARAAPDGHTLLVYTNAHAANAALHANLPYDALRDFVPVAPIAAMPFVLVAHPGAGVRTLADLVAAARSKPGGLSYASAGTGSATHLVAEHFRAKAGIQVVHVPYKGGAEAMNDTVAGRTAYWFPSIGTALPLIKSGQLVALGVTGSRRSALLPDVPTLAESGLAGFDDTIWFGVWAPAGTPGSIVERLAEDIAQALSQSDLRQRLESLGGQPLRMPPAEFDRFVRTQAEATVGVIRSSGVKPE